MPLSSPKAFLPEQPLIDAYGNGGFRFADMSHQGSLLFLPGGVFRWDIDHMDQLQIDSFREVFDQKDRIEFLILGTGKTQIFPSLEIRKFFEEQLVGLDIMDTGAACRTYNICKEEKRAVAAALIAVESSL